MKQKFKRALSYFLSGIILTTSIGFSSVMAKEEFIINKDFTTADGCKNLADDQITIDMQNAGTYLSDPVYNTEKAALQASKKRSSQDASIYYYGALMYGGQDKTDNLSLTGNVVFEAEMAFDTMTAIYYPLAITPAVTTSDGFRKWQGHFSKDGFKVTGGKCYVNDVELCDITANEYYTFQMAVAVDGDTTTTDELICTVIDKNGKTYTAVSALDTTTSKINSKTMDSIKSVSIIRYNSYGVAEGATASTYIKSLKGYYAETLPTVTSSVANNATVDAGSDITLTFNTEMNTASFANIKLKDAEGNEVTDATYEATDAKTCVVTLPQDLEGAYTLNVPRTVISKDGFGVSITTVSFTATVNENNDNEENLTGTFLNKDFTTSDGCTNLADDQITIDLQNAGTYLSDPVYNTEKAALQASKKRSNQDTSIYYYGALMYGGQDKTDNLNLKGNVVFEAKMAFDTMTAIHYPLAITPVVTTASSMQRWKGYFSQDGFKVTGGKCYVNDAELCDITANEYYTFKMAVAVDGDTTTTDELICTVIDKNGNTYTAVSALDTKKGDMDSAKMDSIKSINVVRYNSYGVADGATASTYIKSLKGYYAETLPTVTSSVADGATDVEAGSDITLTFNTDMNTASFANIKLKDTDGNTVSGVTYEATNAKTCVVTLPQDLEGTYTLNVPKTVISKDGFGVGAKIGFTTKGSDNNNNDNQELGVIFNKNFSDGCDAAFVNGLYGGIEGFQRSAQMNVAAGSDSLELSFSEASKNYLPDLTFGGAKANPNLALKGDFVLEAQMQFDTLEGAEYYPLALQPDTKSASSWAFAINMISIKEGKVYINETEMGAIKANTPYKFKVIVSIDGDVDTTTDPFYAEVTGENVNYSGAGTLLRTRGYGYQTNFEAITIVNILRGTSTNKATVNVKSFKGYYINVPKFTTSFKDGSIILKFNDTFDASKFSGISLSDGEEKSVKATVSPESGTSDTITITPEGNFAYDSVYILNFPELISTSGLTFIARKASIKTPLQEGVEAEIKLPDLISDNMLIQQAKPIKLWGTAHPGEKLTIKLGKGDNVVSEGTTTVNEDGTFKAELPQATAGGPYTLTFTTTTRTATVENVMVGELWVQSGQSNMVLAVASTGKYKEEMLPEGKVDGIRFFYNVQATNSKKEENDLEGQWMVADPTTVNSYSAVGYTALQKLYDELQIPVGGICNAVGGIGMEGMTGPYEGEEAGLAYNAKMAPLTNFNIRGIMWYQGEASDKTSVETFTTPFDKLIKSWRTAWNDNKLPLVYVVLPPYPNGYGDDFSYPRVAQLKAFYTHENVSIAVSADCPPDDISNGSVAVHPINKKPIGERLALSALDMIYNTIDNGMSPLYKKATVNGNTVVITFTNAYDGLKTTDGKAPISFMVAGSNGTFYPATAEITGTDTIKLTCAEVDEIKQISYALEKHLFPQTTVSDYARVNLVNSEGIPACPFLYNVTDEMADKLSQYSMTEEIKLSANTGDVVNLPATVTLKNAQGQPETKNVNWEKVNTNIAGEQTIYGVVEGTDILVWATLTLTGEDINDDEDDNNNDNEQEDTVVPFVNRDFTTTAGCTNLAADTIVVDQQGTAGVKLETPVFDEAQGALKAQMTKKHDGGHYTKGALMYGSKDRSGEDCGLLDLKGNVVFETEMAFDNMSAKHYVLAITPIQTTNTVLPMYKGYFSQDGFMVTEGKCYVDGVELCDIEAGKYYKFQMRVTVDGNIETTDELICTVTDENGNTYTATGLLDTVKGDMNSAAMDSIKSINVIRYNIGGIGDNEVANTYIKSLKGYILPSPEFTSSIKDGAKDVEITNKIELTFNHLMQASMFSDIKLYMNSKLVEINISPATGTSKKCTITIPGGLINNRDYKLVVPGILSDGGFSSMHKEINFSTVPKESNINVSNISVNLGDDSKVTAGETITVKADVMNTSAAYQDASIIIGVYNKEGKLKKLATAEEIILGLDDIDIEAQIVVPDDLGTDGFIRVFCWNSFTGMKALADMKVLP